VTIPVSAWGGYIGHGSQVIRVVDPVELDNDQVGWLSGVDYWYFQLDP
jgi:hypothetical protein